jgi:hypothetical protein
MELLATIEFVTGSTTSSNLPLCCLAPEQICGKYRELSMSRRSAKWWLAMAALLLLTPVMSATRQSVKERGCGTRDRDRKCRQVPEGGSMAAYLLGAGVTCFGAMVVRSRLVKPQTR